MDRGEKDQFSPQFRKQIEIVLIVEAERLVPGDRNAGRRLVTVPSHVLIDRFAGRRLRMNRRLRPVLRRLHRRRRVRDPEQRFQVDRFFQDICQVVNLSLQVLHFFGLQKSQVAALPGETVILGQISDDLQR